MSHVNVELWYALVIPRSWMAGIKRIINSEKPSEAGNILGHCGMFETFDV